MVPSLDAEQVGDLEHVAYGLSGLASTPVTPEIKTQAIKPFRFPGRLAPSSGQFLPLQLFAGL